MGHARKLLLSIYCKTYAKCYEYAEFGGIDSVYQSGLAPGSEDSHSEHHTLDFYCNNNNTIT